jgi:hypothetical protein
MADPISGAIGGSAILGAVASNKASKRQSKAAKNAAQLQQQQYEQTRADQMPFLQAGYGSLNRLNELLGITPAGGGEDFIPEFDEAAYLRANPDVAASVARGATASGLAHYNKYGRREGRAMPMTTDPSLAPRSADFGKYGRDFAMSDYQADPGYAFRLSEGMKALDRQAAARGGLMSGGALKAATRFGQDLGSQEYQNAFNRYQVNRSNQLTPLQSMAGMGQTTAQQLGSAGQNYATNAGNAYGAAAQAQASGYMGAANAIGQGVGQYVGYQSNNNLLAALERGQASGGGGYGAYTPANYGFGSNVRLGAP